MRALVGEAASKAHEPVDIFEVAHQAERESDSACALVIDAAAKLVETQALRRFRKARAQFFRRDAERRLAAARVAEATRPQGYIRPVGAILYDAMVNEMTLTRVKVARDRTASGIERDRPINPGDR